MTPQTVLDVLRAAREKIATPERWTKGAEARTVHGDVTAIDDSAASWCVDGSIWDVTRNLVVAGLCFDALYAAMPTAVRITTYNDAPTTTHADIMALFDRAIAAEEA